MTDPRFAILNPFVVSLGGEHRDSHLGRAYGVADAPVAYNDCTEVAREQETRRRLTLMNTDLLD